MPIPADRLLKALIHEVEALKGVFADSNVDGSAMMSIANGLQILLNRETGGPAAVRQRLAEMGLLLQRLAPVLTSGSDTVRASFSALQEHLGTGQQLQALGDLEAAWQHALASAQALVAQLNQAHSLTAGDRQALLEALVGWESADLQALAAPAATAASADAEAFTVTKEKLTAYLRDRFQDPALQVTSFQPLAGGFGKQTLLFDVVSQELNGAFVMRRDIGGRPSVANDCHRIRDEYPVIQAAFARGFPAPDALWLDTEQRLLPGADFIVMRRSPGQLAGNFFGARTEIPGNLTDALADVMAQLHTQAPLTELGNLTDSIRLDRWNLSRGDCTARYIRGWYDLYLREEHSPSPALTALYGWLLDNVPDRPGRPSLLHGDIGYHNFLFDDGGLSAVLDWEFAHIGDPAEELGYVKVTLGDAVDWQHLMARYLAGGGDAIDEKTLRYFQVWAYARNATGANLLSTLLARGHAQDLKLAILPVAHIPMFLRGAQALIASA